MKLSFISAGLSSFGNTIEDTFYSQKFDQRSSHRFYETTGTIRSSTTVPTPATDIKGSFVDQPEQKTRKHQHQPQDSQQHHYVSTPPRNSSQSPTPPRHVRYSTPSRSERYHQHPDHETASSSDEEIEVPKHFETHRNQLDINQSLVTPTIPPKTPLKGILRTPIRPPPPSTPIHTNSSGNFHRNHIIQMLSPAMSPIHVSHGDEHETNYDPHTMGGYFEASDSDISIPPFKGDHRSGIQSLNQRKGVSSPPFPPASQQRPQGSPGIATNTSTSQRSEHSLSLADLQHLSYLDLSISEAGHPIPPSHPPPRTALPPNESIFNSSSTGSETLQTLSLLDITSNTSQSQSHQRKQSKSRKSSRRSHRTSSEAVRNSDSFLASPSQRYPAYPGDLFSRPLHFTHIVCSLRVLSHETLFLH